MNPIAPSQLPRSTSSKRRSRMLIVEDDPELAAIVARVAGMIGLDLAVDVATTEADARQRLATAQYDFVLLDNFLDHGAQGIDLVDLVKRRQPCAGMAMMSSMELSDFIELTAHESAIQILPKPFSVDLLRAFLHEVMGPGRELAPVLRIA